MYLVKDRLSSSRFHAVSLFNFFDPAGSHTLILIKISVCQPAGSKKLNNIVVRFQDAVCLKSKQTNSFFHTSLKKV